MTFIHAVDANDVDAVVVKTAPVKSESHASSTPHRPKVHIPVIQSFLRYYCDVYILRR